MSNIPLKIILLPLVTLLVTYVPILVISQVPTSEREILLNIKKQWDDQPAMQSWNSTTSPCLWPGIKCDNDDAVTGVLLGSQNLNGTLPPSICELKNLTTLDVSNNNIVETFPTFLYNCSKLQTLSLAENYFVGLLPNDLSKLSPSLKHFDLSGNNFTGDIPSEIGQLKELITLHLDQNMLNGTFPYELGHLENLEELVLTNNPFSPMSLPKEFGNLKSLKLLYMAQCNLIGEIPKSFSNLSSIETLDLVQNNLVGEIPSGVFLLKNLTYLYLYDNKLSGGLPSSMEALNMVELDVSMNYLMTGPIPEGISKMQKLELLALFDNQFNGTLPSGIGQMPSLRKLKIFNNRFHGPLPQDIGLHSKLEGFEVSSNGFSGPLPEHLCEGGALLGVVAFNNHLNGTIPSSLGQCNALLTVELYNNSFSGEVPKGLWTVMNISILQLSNNQFSGQLPEKLAGNLTRIEIDNNRFSGNIPLSVRDWGALMVFTASNNMISGKIPLELTSLSRLNLLQLSGNRLSGELPSEIISWQDLNNLNLSNNQLSGLIPPVLCSVSVLNYLDLSSNLFSGQIPPEFGQLKLSSLNLSSNKLTGVIPLGFDNSAFQNSFLSTNLCSNGGVSDLPKCSIFRQKTKTLSTKHLAVVLVLALIAFLAMSYFTVYLIGEFRQRHNQDLATWKLTSFHKLNFTEDQILNNLNEGNMIGSGGSGQVYRIPVNGSGDAVAVKRIWNNKKMNITLEKEFLAEVEILATIRHINIVKLLCSISSESSKLLVYEYVKNRSLDQWIHESRRQPVSSVSGAGQNAVLDWPARLRVAIGAAQGLSYMHHDCSPPIIHRDVKSSNILLDSEFNAKIADFGLAKILAKPGGEPNTVSAVAGSFGYMAPEYCHTTKVNEKIDIYSFGVVLLELVTGKEPHIGDEHRNLAEWAWKHYSEGHSISNILDKEINDAEYVEEMTNVFKLGLMCTSTLPSSRPTMKGVLQVLKKCNVLEGSGRAKDGNERDFFPLLESGYFVSSCKNSKRGKDEDDYSMV